MVSDPRTKLRVVTISVAHATVTQNVSHAPVKPKYGFEDFPNIFVSQVQIRGTLPLTIYERG